MLNKLGLVASVIALPWLSYRCITSEGPRIQALLQSAVSRAGEAASIAGVKVAADGREIVLTGTVANAELKARAGGLALATPGVRNVDNRLVVLAPPPVPPPPPAAVVQERLNQILEKRIEFETGKAVLLPESEPVLNAVLDVLREAPMLAVTIEGHTDNRGDAGVNRTLSEARARTVASWLSERGISASRVQSAGFGPDRPVAPNTSVDGRARNRRVDITAR